MHHRGMKGVAPDLGAAHNVLTVGLDGFAAKVAQLVGVLHEALVEEASLAVDDEGLVRDRVRSWVS